jgi:hypothetical protein
LRRNFSAAARESEIPPGVRRAAGATDITGGAIEPGGGLNFPGDDGVVDAITALAPGVERSVD